MTKNIPLTRGYSALVDDADFEWLSLTPWVANGPEPARIYALRTGPDRRHLYMHRLIMAAPAGVVVDHINRDPLDNRRANLRLCSQAQNSKNQDRAPGASGFYGVSRTPSGWRAFIQKPGGKKQHLGCFAQAEDAARFRDAAEFLAHGEFARLNFSPSDRRGR